MQIWGDDDIYDGVGTYIGIVMIRIGARFGSNGACIARDTCYWWIVKILISIYYLFIIKVVDKQPKTSGSFTLLKIAIIQFVPNN